MSKVRTATICVSAVVIATVSLTACGPSDGATKTATASLKSELLQQSKSGASPFTFSDTQAQCTAHSIASGVGAKALQQYGLLDAQLKSTTKTLDDSKMSSKDATTVVEAVINCLGEANFDKVLSNAVNKSITGEKTQSQRDCLQSKLTVTTLKPMLISALTGDQAPAQKFYTGLASCIPSAP